MAPRQQQHKDDAEAAAHNNSATGSGLKMACLSKNKLICKTGGMIHKQGDGGSEPETCLFIYLSLHLIAEWSDAI